jgi:hypothetical protein
VTLFPALTLWHRQSRVFLFTAAGIVVVTATPSSRRISDSTSAISQFIRGHSTCLVLRHDGLCSIARPRRSRQRKRRCDAACLLARVSEIDLRRLSSLVLVWRAVPFCSWHSAVDSCLLNKTGKFLYIPGTFGVTAKSVRMVGALLAADSE